MTRAFSVALIGLLLPLAAHAERTAPEWLDYMTRAMRESNYAGTFVYHQGKRLEAMRIAHRADSHGERERLVSLTGQRREILREGQRVLCVFADRDAVVVDRRHVRNPLTDLVPADGDELGEHYRLGVGGEGRVANRSVVRVRIEPRDDYRYGYKLAIDRKTGLLLGSELVAERGDAPIEQIMFTSIELPETIPESALERQLGGSDFVWQRRDPKANGSTDLEGGSDWRIDRVPAGFQLSQRRRHAMPGRDVMVEHWLYTDGLATISVYMEATGDKSGAFHGRSGMGALNVYGRKVGAHQVVVVGEVPVETVETLGQSIRRRDGATP